MSARRLIVMRHAKAGPYAADDHARDLIDRGRRDAAEAGAWLAAHGLVPTHALVSSAVRTVATWEAVATASGADAEVAVSDDLYEANPMTSITALRKLPEDAACVIIVGHNPNVEHLANLLDDGDGEPEAIDQLHESYPTSAMAVFDIAKPWSELRRNSCRVSAFHVGRG